LVPIAIVVAVVVVVVTAVESHSLVDGVKCFSFLCNGLERQNRGNCFFLGETTVLAEEMVVRFVELSRMIHKLPA